MPGLSPECAGIAIFIVAIPDGFATVAHPVDKDRAWDEGTPQLGLEETPAAVEAGDLALSNDLPVIRFAVRKQLRFRKVCVCHQEFMDLPGELNIAQRRFCFQVSAHVDGSGVSRPGVGIIAWRLD